MNLKIVLILAISLGSCGERDTRSPAEKILTLSELSMSPLVQPSEFFVVRPNFDPRMFAKFSLDKQQAKDLEDLVNGKQRVKIGRSKPPSFYVSWWKPSEGAFDYTYRTSRNGLVNVVISSSEDGKEALIWWASP